MRKRRMRRRRDTPAPSYSLEELLANTAREMYAPTVEDREWLDAPPVGREILPDDYKPMPEAAKADR